MLAVVLVSLVAVGIAWPFLRERGLVPNLPGMPRRGEAPEEGTQSTVRAREELCPYCSRLNPAGAAKCVDCNSEMPVADFRHLWDNNGKQELVREGVQCGVLLGVMVLAMALSYNLPLMGKLLVLLVTIAGLAYRFWRTIQE